jgi:hypothetical protein
MSATGVRPAGTEATDFAAEDDGELIRQIASGSTGAFEELHERYHGRAYRLARSICGEDGRAEEAVQEAFVSIWRSAASYEMRGGAAAGWSSAWTPSTLRHASAGPPISQEPSMRATSIERVASCARRL